MRRLLALITLLPLVVAGFLTTTATPASAYAARNDPASDAPSGIDTRVARLYENFKNTVTVQMYSNTYRPGAHFNGVEVDYDTAGSSAVDYRLVWSFKGDLDGYDQFVLLRVVGSRRTAVDCPGMSAKVRGNGHLLEMYVPRSCMSLRKTVGVATRAWDYQRYSAGGVPTRGIYDRAPDRGWMR